MRRTALKAIAAAVVAVACGAGVARAEDSPRERQVDGMTVYLGVLPSELLAANALEADRHGGIPKGPGYHHVLIALFDSKTGERISDAEVSARVEDVARTLTVEKRLEAMKIADTITFGNFFFMPGRDPYSIHVTIDRHGHGTSEVTFHYRHT